MMECCRCASIRDGELSIEMDGPVKTPKLPADNWDHSTVLVTHAVM